MTIKNNFKLLVVVFVMFALAVPAAVLGQRSEGLVTGRILDAEGRVIKNVDVRVFAYWQGQWIEGFYIKDQGRYSMQLPRGEWFIGAEIEPESGYTGSDINLPVSVNGSALIRNITLQRLSAVISGKILKSDGTTLPKALVSLFNSPMLFSTETDLNGAYRFLVPSGKYLLRAFSSPDKGGINPQSEELVLKNGQLADLSLIFKSPDIKLSGQVTLFDSPADVALVWAWSDEGGYSEVRTDNFGNYELKVRANENWHVEAVKVIDIFPYKSKTIDIFTRNSNVELDIELQASVSRLPKRKSQKFSSAKTNAISVSLSNGMRLSLPPGAVDVDEVTVSITPFIGPNQKSVDVVGTAYRINLLDSNNQLIRKLKKSGVLEIPYSSSDLKKVNANENDLKVFFWDDNASAWRSNGNSVVVKRDKFLLGLVDHFSEFVVADPEGGGEPPGDAPPVSVESGRSGGGSGSPAPRPRLASAPSIINASAGQNSVIVEFFDFDVSRDEKYRLQVSETNSNFVDVGESVTESPFVDTSNLKPGATYFYRIIATNAVGDSLPSPVDSVVIPSDTEAPLISDEVDVSFTAENKVKFTFTTNETAVSSVDYGVASVSEEALENVNFLSVHSLTGDVQGDTAYRYRITVSDEAGNVTVSPIRTFISPLFVVPPPPVSSESGPSPAGPPGPSGPPPSTGSSSQIPEILKGYRFTRTIRIGSTGIDVLRLQQALNALGFVIADSGPGSPGNETTYFGSLSAGALMRFQKEKIPAILSAQGIPNGIPILGNATRIELNAGLK